MRGWIFEGALTPTLHPQPFNSPEFPHIACHQYQTLRPRDTSDHHVIGADHLALPLQRCANLARMKGGSGFKWQDLKACGEGFDEVQALVTTGNYYRALKICRKLFPPESPSAGGEGGTKAAKSPVVVTKVRRRPLLNQPE